MRQNLPVATVWLVSVLLLAAAMLPVNADDKVMNDRSGNPFMDEVVSAPNTESLGWQSIYSAYSCVYHHSYALAGIWLRDSLKQGAGSQILRAGNDIAYLSAGLSAVAAKRHEAAVPESSCDAQILQALMQCTTGNQSDAVDTLKRVVINNPSYPSLKSLKAMLKSMEFEQAGNLWLTPPDVEQIGGKGNYLSRWRMDKFPLKVYVPTDAVAAKIAGYKAGDGQLLRSAFETWQKQSNGKIRFAYEPVQSRADIICTWVSNEKDLQVANAVGVCSRSGDAYNYLFHAQIRVLTCPAPSGFNNQYRKNYLGHVCMHEVGHSLGLNHSPKRTDVMYGRGDWTPLTLASDGDLAALSSLYLTNVHEYIGAALDAIECGQYRAALAPLDKAIMANPKDSQSRHMIFICLGNAGTSAMIKEDYTTAMKLLEKASQFASAGESTESRERVLKNLHYAYLQSGRSKEAEDLEQQHASLQTASKDSASFLDQYGIKRESIPYYETALAKTPDDLAIRAKFSFLLVMLARDEMGKNDDAEAIALLTRAKALLRAGMPQSIITKVITTLRQVYLNEQRYDEADQVGNDLVAILPQPEVKIDTPEDDIAYLVSEAKKKHPEAWSIPDAEQSQRTKVELAYGKYVDALRQCAATLNANDQPTWAIVFIVKAKRYDRRGAQDPLGTMFDLRHRLIELTDEGAVIELEARLPLKKIPPAATPSPTKVLHSK